MIMPSDKDYQQTKQLKKSGGAASSPFGELATWISNTYEVTVLDMHYDFILPGNRPRLNVVLEWMRDAAKFNACSFGFDDTRQEIIRMKFQSLLTARGNDRHQAGDLFVCFSSFEAVARIEANQKVTSHELKLLQKNLDNPELWTISKIFDSVTFLFYTDANMEVAKAKGLQQIYARPIGSRRCSV
jgi:hypothetical protein